MDHLIPKKGNDNIIRVGVLQKRNEWFVKQDRFFVLYTNGEMRYYNKEQHRGTIRLTNQA